jgi:hypothetical protein
MLRSAQIEQGPCVTCCSLIYRSRGRDNGLADHDGFHHVILIWDVLAIGKTDFIGCVNLNNDTISYLAGRQSEYTKGFSTA